MYQYMHCIFVYTVCVCVTTVFVQMQETPKETKQGILDTTLFDEAVQNQAFSSSYLAECRERKLQKNNQSNCMECDDVIIVSSPTAPPKPRMKLLQFHTNVRPAYFGSWRKKSKIISGRMPLKKDTVC